MSHGGPTVTHLPLLTEDNSLHSNSTPPLTPPIVSSHITLFMSTRKNIVGYVGKSTKYNGISNQH